MRGAQVLWGRAHESSGAPAYWPWMQVGNSYASSNDLALITPDIQAKLDAALAGLKDGSVDPCSPKKCTVSGS